MFDDILKQLCNYYERKVFPLNSAHDLWFKKTENIPDEAAFYIRDRIYEELESFPKNLPKIMWAFYHEWIEAHPEKRAKLNYFNCPDCNEGLIFCRKKNSDDKYIRYVFKCSRCKQDHTPGYPMDSKKGLIEKGYEFEIPFAAPVKRSLADIKKSVGREIPAPNDYDMRPSP